jgi:hypothetical protein
MKSKIMFIALYSVAFMFPSIGTVDTADALADISHCANLEATAARPACEAAAHGSMGGAPAPFDDGLMGAPGMSGAAITGSDSVVCGGFKSYIALKR